MLNMEPFGRNYLESLMQLKCKSGSFYSHGYQSLWIDEKVSDCGVLNYQVCFNLNNDKFSVCGGSNTMGQCHPRKLISHKN